ncbi:DUF2306 domain-containing protein [Nitratireductor sp. XY-223]|uniref:DUF2306 domain-containing protein n=1 Tax=Nitratireductor sp. XY-223 TaxID=2561926 RepID=UPI00197CCBD7|nr:DUF2306 domain-containing protein [Nitratireductor sp. XY-223]
MLEPLLAASAAIQIHVVSAIGAALLGAVIFLRPKGSPAHRLAGRVWVGLMAIAALSSFAIYELRLWGRWSPIHILSILTLASLLAAVLLARAGMIRSHRLTMVSTYVGALLIAGAFSFAPERIMHKVLIVALTAGKAVAGD